MKKIMKWVIGIAVIIMFSFLYAHIAKTHILYDNRVDTSKYMGTGVLSEKIEQKFVLEEDYLDGITIKCSIQGTPADSTVKISLKDDETGKIVAKSELKLKDIKNSKFNVFKFDRISECKGKTYTLYVENPDGDVEKTLGVGFSYEPKTEKGTELLINGNNVDGTLIAKTVTNRFDMETFCVVLLFVLYIVFFVKFLYRLFK